MIDPHIRLAAMVQHFWVLLGVIAAAIGVGLMWFFNGLGAIANLLQMSEARSKLASLRRAQLHSFTEADMLRATRYYVNQFALGYAPTNHDEIVECDVADRVPLFRQVDNFIKSPSAHDRMLLILSDSGTGKTSFCLNYLAACRRRLFGGHRVCLARAGDPNLLEFIRSVDSPQSSVIMLDALDEDPRAFDNLAARLDELELQCARFAKIIVTCRRQFFRDKDSIPTTMRQIENVSSRAAGESTDIPVRVIYIAPFSESDIQRYVAMRHPFWRPSARKRIADVISKIPALAARPMLLAYVSDFDEQTLTQLSGASVWDLYARCITTWIERDNPRGIDYTPELSRVSQSLAVAMFLESRRFGGPRPIGLEEVRSIARLATANLSLSRVTSRSLLVPTQSGEWKFAHNSFMEWFVVASILQGNRLCAGIALTDVMLGFMFERLYYACDIAAGLTAASDGGLTWCVQYVDAAGTLMDLFGKAGYQVLARDDIFAWVVLHSAGMSLPSHALQESLKEDTVMNFAAFHAGRRTRPSEAPLNIESDPMWPSVCDQFPMYKHEEDAKNVYGVTSPIDVPGSVERRERGYGIRLYAALLWRVRPAQRGLYASAMWLAYVWLDAGGGRRAGCVRVEGFQFSHSHYAYLEQLADGTFEARADFDGPLAMLRERAAVFVTGIGSGRIRVVPEWSLPTSTAKVDAVQFRGAALDPTASELTIYLSPG